jgi:hypothetical protein
MVWQLQIQWLVCAWVFPVTCLLWKPRLLESQHSPHVLRSQLRFRPTLLLSVWVWVEISQGYLLVSHHSLLIITEQIGVAAALNFCTDTRFESTPGQQLSRLMFSRFYSVPLGKFSDSIPVRQLPLPSRSLPFHYLRYHRRLYSPDTDSIVQ